VLLTLWSKHGSRHPQKEIHMRRALAVLLGSAVALLLVGAASASAATTVVRPSAMDSWTAQTNDASGTPVPFGTCANGSVSFVSGPATPPLGVGSAELTTGNVTSGGDCAAQLRNTAYAGMKLSDLNALSYSTYVNKNNGQQAPYLSLEVNNSGNAGGSVDDIVFFEPPYQQPTTGDPSLPDQGAVAYDTWQSWNALEGGWWDNNGELGYGGSQQVQPLSAYVTAHPNAVIVNASTGGGVRLAVGYASPGDQFDGNVDAFTIGTAASTTTYDFEPNLPSPTTKDQCKNGGWQNYADANGTPFKNQGDCVSYVATGGKNTAHG
jgi:hypothetical protein